MIFPTHILMLIGEGIFILVFSTYFLLLILLGYSWLSLPKFRSGGMTPEVKISVVIAARNEAEKIVDCLQALQKQTYPHHRFEVILADDSSEDETGDLAERFAGEQGDFSMRVIRLKPMAGLKTHKKRALSEAILQTTGELIVTTDADCLPAPGWLHELAAFYEKEKPVMIIGPVAFLPGQRLFGRMQALEFLALLGVTGAAANLGVPLLCNGANLAYPKKVFEEVGGFTGDDVASGDDMLLMKRVAEKYPGKVRFLASEKALVWTHPEPDLGSFLRQRKRWASKFSVYGPGAIRSIAVLVFLVNALFLAGVPLFFLFPKFRMLYVILGAGKLIIDFLFLFLAASFTDKKGLLLLYIPEQIFYSSYVVLSALSGLQGAYSWKGRDFDPKAGNA